ncbi:MAG: PKD domain-containing protein, partial [Pseudomonadota bacterium]
SANPGTVNYGGSSVITWSSTNATSCTASGDWSGAKNLSGSQSTGSLTQVKTYSYTLTCAGAGGSASGTANVVVNAPVPTVSNVTATDPDYCVSGPAATIGWTYSDPAGSPQSAYQVQITNTGNFNNPMLDSGKILSSSNSYFTGQGILVFNTTYKARVRVWNGFDAVSDWTVSGSFKTPSYAYPQVNFTWTANDISENPSPPLDKPVQFTDQTVFQGNPNGREWYWTFGDGGNSTLQNPLKTYSAEGTFYVTLTATDNANQSCSKTRGPLIIQKPIPRWREVAPR